MWTQVAIFGTAAVVAAMLAAMLRLRMPPWTFIILFGLSVAVVLSDAGWRTLSHHGLMHAGIVYEILERGVPPEHPLLAGEPLRYPYGLHLAVAGIVRPFPISPSWVFAAVNLVSILLFCFVLDRAARHVSPASSFRAAAVLIALLGLNLFTYGPAAQLLSSFGWAIEPRSLPWRKFTTVNANQAGFVMASLALLALVRLGTGMARLWPSLALLAGAVAGAAALYPPSWVLAMAWSGAASLELLRRRETARVGLLTAGTALGASAAVLPYLASVSAAGSGLLPETARLGRNGAILLAALAPWALLAWLRRRELAEIWRPQVRTARILLLAAAASLVLFLGLSLPLATEYKLLAGSMLPLGLLAAPVLGVRHVRPAAVMALLSLMIWPAVASVWDVFGWRAADPVVSRGRDLRHAVPAEDALYRWIARESPPQAMFVDDRLTIPPLGHRQLFVGLDGRLLPAGEHDGWEMTAAMVLEDVTSADLRRIAVRRRLAAALIDPGSSPLPGSLRQQILWEARGRPLYVVARQEAVRRRLAAAGWLRPVYRGDAVTIFWLATPRR